MAVIINEFEVIPDMNDGTEKKSTETTPPAEQGAQLTPLDMRDVLRFQMDRMMRTWAD
jgi:hypothetical protein